MDGEQCLVREYRDVCCAIMALSQHGDYPHAIECLKRRRDEVQAMIALKHATFDELWESLWGRSHDRTKDYDAPLDTAHSAG